MDVPLWVDDRVGPILDAFKSKKAAAVLGVVPALIGLRASLPALLRNWINHALKSLSGRGLIGSVDDIDVNFWQGRVSLKGIAIRSDPDAAADHRLPIDGACTIGSATAFISWSALLSGSIAADVVIDRPRIVLTKPAEPRPPLECVPHRRAGDKTWRQRLHESIPVKINRASLRSGEVVLQHFLGPSGEELALRGLYCLARNLTNDEALSSSTKTKLDVEGNVPGDGSMRLQAQGFPLSEIPTFEADVAIRGVNLRDLGFLFREWMGVRVDSGILDFYAEAAAAQGSGKGYVKPLIDKMHVEKIHKGLIGNFRALGFKLATGILRNKQVDRIATRLDFSGPFCNFDIHYGSAAANFLKNAFSQAFKPRLDHSIFFSHFGKTPERTEIVIPRKPDTVWSRIFSMIKESVGRWSDDNAMQMSASLSYYAAFSLAPLLILVIAAAGLAYGHTNVADKITRQVSLLIGRQSASAILSMVQTARKPFSGIIATIIGIVTLLVGASTIVRELKSSLNFIWRVKTPEGFGALIRNTLGSYAMVLAGGFLLLVSLVASALLSAAGHFLADHLSFSPFVIYALNGAISFVIIMLVFALIYKFLPDASIDWHDVWMGSAVTSALFSFGKFVIGTYLAKASFSSTYGAAGSVLVILTWVYYSSMIFYLGAEFTKVYADRYGSNRSAQKPSPAIAGRGVKNSTP